MASAGTSASNVNTNDRMRADCMRAYSSVKNGAASQRPWGREGPSRPRSRFGSAGATLPCLRPGVLGRDLPEWGPAHPFEEGWSASQRPFRSKAPAADGDGERFGRPRVHFVDRCPPAKSFCYEMDVRPSQLVLQREVGGCERVSPAGHGWPAEWARTGAAPRRPPPTAIDARQPRPSKRPDGAAGWPFSSPSTPLVG
jgi:hypothetical protein